MHCDIRPTGQNYLGIDNNPTVERIAKLALEQLAEEKYVKKLIRKLEDIVGPRLAQGVKLSMNLSISYPNASLATYSRDGRTHIKAYVVKEIKPSDDKKLTSDMAAITKIDLATI